MSPTGTKSAPKHPGTALRVVSTLTPTPERPPATEQSGNTVGKSHTTFWLLASLCGIFVLQWFGKPSSVDRTPGPQRGDIVLVQDDLASTINGWSRQTFQSAEEAEKLPEWQWWWVHQWIYQNPQGSSAIVSFDQLGLSHWHELTHCYQGLGWKLTKRDILQEDIQDSEHPWEFVVAEFEKVTGETAILVFSTFYEDGSPAEALRIGIDHDWDEKQDLLTTLKARLTTSESDQPQHTRALQCQVFSTRVATDTTPDIQRESGLKHLTELHLSTRRSLKERWLRAEHVRTRSSR